MALGRCFVVLSLCCVVGWGASILALGKQEETLAQGRLLVKGIEEKLGQRTVLWLASVAGFYGLVWLTELCNVQDTTVMDCVPCPARLRCYPKHSCSLKSTLSSLGQVEQEVVTLLYKLHRHRIALTGVWRHGSQNDSAAQAGLPNDLVIYTICDES